MMIVFVSSRILSLLKHVCMDDHTCSYRDIAIAIDILADCFKMQSLIDYK